MPMPLDLAFIEGHIKEMRDIEAARVRLEEGTLEICSVCGTQTSLERVRACPTAERCVDCQRQCDKTHVQETAPTL